MLGEIAALPEQQRRAFLAVAVEGRRHRDVGDELGVSEGAVRMLIHRARSSVRAAAAAFSPGPLIAWFKGLGGGAAAGGTAAGGTGGLAAAGATAGAGLLATGAVKVGVIVATSVVVAAGGPPAVQQIRSHVSHSPQAGVVSKAPASHAVARVADPPSERPTVAAPADAAPAADFGTGSGRRRAPRRAPRRRPTLPPRPRWSPSTTPRSRSRRIPAPSSRRRTTTT